MVWDLGLSQMGKSHDAIFFEDKLPGLKLKMGRTRQYWSTWTVPTPTPSQFCLPHTEVGTILTDEDTSTPRLTMRERRLSASIHNHERSHTDVLSENESIESSLPASNPNILIVESRDSSLSLVSPPSPSTPTPDPRSLVPLSPPAPVPSPPPAPRRGTRQ